MRKWLPTAARIGLVTAFATGAPSVVWSQVIPSALAGNIAAAPNARIDGRGDWRRHEIVRTWRDENGCRLSFISYHHPGGKVDSRQVLNCGKD